MGEKSRGLLQINESQPGGLHRIQWNGRDAGGGPVASGPYFYTVILDGTQLGVKKSLLTR